VARAIPGQRVRRASASGVADSKRALTMVQQKPPQPSGTIAMSAPHHGSPIQAPEIAMATTDPLSTVHQYIDAFNEGDGEAQAAMFAVPGSILDGMAPHLWRGPTASRDWYRDVLLEGEQHGASGYLVTLGVPLHNDVTGDSAYVVIPATMKFEVRGQKVTQTGAVYTVALRKLAEGWRIAAWAWAKGTAQ
jgi:ketosteroid isomerase-like protein